MISEERRLVLEKIKLLESLGRFNEDVENDPPTRTLMSGDVDYLGKKLSTKIKTFFANKVAVNYYEKLIKKGQFVIKEVKGLENYESVKGGAIITCNHFSPLDNYAVYRAIRPYLNANKRNLYKVIREGNYTNFGGIYGFFFRNCNTLPLSSNLDTMKKFMSSVDCLLKRGDKILIYPEQAMWWNYRKPRPLKNGAFKFAAKSDVPVIPSFITMEDTDKIDSDGTFVQAYTVWFLPPIYPPKDLSVKEKTDYMAEENYKVWKELYEKVYQTPLTYGE